MKRMAALALILGVGALACSAQATQAPTLTPYPTYTPYPTQTSIPAPRPTPTVKAAPTLQPILLAEARDTLRDNGFGYSDQWIDDTTSDTVTYYAYRYLSVGIYITLWTADGTTLSEIHVMFPFDDNDRTRLEYANRGIMALRGIIPDGMLSALADLNTAYNASPYEDVSQDITGTPYVAHFYRWDYTETCPAEYSWCYLSAYPAITYSGTAMFSFYMIDIVLY
jgi:hypothetical protein